MGPYNDLLTTDIRRIILEALEQDNGYSHNESILGIILEKFGHHVSRDLLRSQLSWLQEQGLVTIDDAAGQYVATITRRGADVATGAASVPGVKRPAPRG